MAHKSTRLPHYDYSNPGSYFVTLKTYKNQPLYGKIIKHEIILSPWGKIAEKHYLAIREHFPFVEIDDYILLSNHLHGIVWITDTQTEDRDTACRVPTFEDYGKPVKGSLSTIIRSYKSAVSREIRRKSDFSGNKIWQARFYEHIIRNEMELIKIREYIRSNAIFEDNLTL